MAVVVTSVVVVVVVVVLLLLLFLDTVGNAELENIGRVAQP